MKIAVIDGQGGGIGKALVEIIRARLGDKVRITALGTNSAATVAMLKAGADEGATGENAVIFNAPKAEVITGPLGIIASNSMMGEFTGAMARAVAESPAHKILVPVNRCNMVVAGLEDMPLPRYLEMAVDIIEQYLKNNYNSFDDN